MPNTSGVIFGQRLTRKSDVLLSVKGVYFTVGQTNQATLYNDYLDRQHAYYFFPNVRNFLFLTQICWTDHWYQWVWDWQQENKNTQFFRRLLFVGLIQLFLSFIFRLVQRIFGERPQYQRYSAEEVCTYQGMYRSKDWVSTPMVIECTHL